jgi:hypothetical protein
VRIEDPGVEGGRPLDVELAASPSPPRSGGEVRWLLTVTNRSADGVVLTFPTAQLGDVTLARDGVERYRWSDGRMFAQVVVDQPLDPAATWTIALDGRLDVEPGAYEAVGVVTCNPRLPTARTTVTVEAHG